MSIKTLYPLSIAPARSETPSVRHGRDAFDDTDRPRLRIVRDRVVISIRARELLDEMRQVPDVDTNIKSLLGALPMTDERAGEVLGRIQHGYYKQPGVMKEVASVLSGALEAES